MLIFLCYLSSLVPFEGEALAAGYQTIGAGNQRFSLNEAASSIRMRAESMS
jgi:hypothetical protein